MKKYLLPSIFSLMINSSCAAPTQTPQWGYDPVSSNPLQYKIGTTWTSVPLFATAGTWTGQQFFGTGTPSSNYLKTYA